MYINLTAIFLCLEIPGLKLCKIKFHRKLRKKYLTQNNDLMHFFHPYITVTRCEPVTMNFPNHCMDRNGSSLQCSYVTGRFIPLLEVLEIFFLKLQLKVGCRILAIPDYL